jgi:hypothetical protein
MGGVQTTPAFRSVAPEPEFSKRKKGSGGRRHGDSVLPMHRHEMEMGIAASRSPAACIDEGGLEAGGPPSRRAWASSSRHNDHGLDYGGAGGDRMAGGMAVPAGVGGGGRHQQLCSHQLKAAGGVGIGVSISDWDDYQDGDGDGDGDGIEAGAGHRGHTGLGMPHDRRQESTGGVHRHGGARGRGGGGGRGGKLWRSQDILDDLEDYEDEDDDDDDDDERNSAQGESLVFHLRQLSSQVVSDHGAGNAPLGRDDDACGAKVRKPASLEGRVGVLSQRDSGSRQPMSKARSVADLLRKEMADSEERMRYHDNLSMAPTRPSSSMLGGGIIAASSRAAKPELAKGHAHPVPPPAGAASRQASKGRPTRFR